MLTDDELMLNFTKYLNKLSKLLEMEAVLSAFSIKLVETKRLNDIFCCIESSWPNIYKNYINVHGDINLKSPYAYTKLKDATMNKFFLSANYCVVRYSDAMKAIYSLKSAIKSDLDYISKIGNN